MITKRISIIFLSLCLAFCSIILISTSVNNKKSNVYADTRTDLIEAGMARAEYMYQYRWTPTQNLGGWGTTFYAGESYTVPYSQPYYYGGYIFYNITLAQFEEYALNGSNGFYNYHDNNGNTSPCPRFGMDCSGFTQVVYATQGINLLRNAREQMTQGNLVPSLAEAQPGDLAFFDHADRDPKATNISHVGLLLSPTEIIHCSGCVHIDTIDEQGIHLPDGELTHHLVQIKRYL